MVKKELTKQIRITVDNISEWPKYQKLLNESKLRFDKSNRLRYLHGAPVGDLLFVEYDKNDNPIYRETADEWFDPDSQKSKQFVW